MLIPEVCIEGLIYATQLIGAAEHPSNMLQIRLNILYVELPCAVHCERFYRVLQELLHSVGVI